MTYLILISKILSDDYTRFQYISPALEPAGLPLTTENILVKETLRPLVDVTLISVLTSWGTNPENI